VLRRRGQIIAHEMTNSSFKYVSCDVPAGQTLAEHRRRRTRPRRRGLLARLRRRTRRR
jgi:hypothetical protein